MPIMFISDGFEATEKIQKLIANEDYMKVIIIGSTSLLTE